MFRETGAHSVLEAEQIAMRLQHNDLSGIHMTGDHIDRVYRHGVLIDERVGHNLVVTSFLHLVMCLLKHQEGFAGIQYWAVGSGSDAWDSDMPLPEANSTRLTNEIGRTLIFPGNIVFLDPSFNVVDTPTNIIQVKQFFHENECNGPWREFGIFGGNATEDLNSGIMVNKRHHPILTKTEDMAVERTMRFTLSLV